MMRKESQIKLFEGDCLTILKTLPTDSVDLVLADMPYGTTRCKWDTVIPLNKLWIELNRVAKQTTPFVLFCAQPFTTILINSNLTHFKYTWVWEKPHAKGHLNAKKRPMVSHEDIAVFYRKQCLYVPQMTEGHALKTATKDKRLNSEVYNNNTKTVSYSSTSRYPRSCQRFKQDTQKSSLHPTQKPLGLNEYLIKTYTNKGDTVLDFCMGSGTTGVACLNQSRKFVGIEKCPEIFKTAKTRIMKDYEKTGTD